jgi:WD repeat and SOF domain-containing protein 1
MKVKVLKRSAGASVERECVGDLRRTSRNLNPNFHPMARAREYTRAVTAAKMDRMFAQPLIGNLGQGHRDAVTCTAVSRKSLLPLVSGGADGVIQLWDLASRTSLAEIAAHSRNITGVCFDRQGEHFLSCSDDGTLQRWTLHANGESSTAAAATAPVSHMGGQRVHESVQTWRCPGSFKSLDYSWKDDDRFATASDDAVQVWSTERSTALQTHRHLWGADDTVNVVRWHPVESHLLAHCSADRGIGLHDTRAAKALKKTVLRMKSNDLQWNPLEPMNFAVANEDYRAYLFDMRKLAAPLKMYDGHTSAVLSLSWAPTGREFVTGSYDRTLRIFEANDGKAREIYHTNRMQRVFCVNYTADAKFVISGSDDSNLRLWKARASEPLGQATTREEAALRYRAKLIQKHQHLPEVRKIYKSRKVPKTIRKQTEQARIMKESADRKQGNRIKYDKKDLYKFSSERKKAVVKEIE